MLPSCTDVAAAVVADVAVAVAAVVETTSASRVLAVVAVAGSVAFVSEVRVSLGLQPVDHCWLYCYYCYCYSCYCCCCCWRPAGPPADEHRPAQRPRQCLC